MDEDITVKQFCMRYVEVMGAESDHVHIVALSDALQVHLALARCKQPDLPVPDYQC